MTIKYKNHKWKEFIYLHGIFSMPDQHTVLSFGIVYVFRDLDASIRVV